MKKHYSDRSLFALTTPSENYLDENPVTFGEVMEWISFGLVIAFIVWAIYM